MNPYLIIFLAIVGVTFLPLIVLIILRTIAYCRLIMEKYPPEGQ